MSLEQLAEWIWVVPLLPLAGAVILLFLGGRIGDPRAGWLATMLLGLAFGLSAAASVPFFTGDGEPQLVTLAEWIPAVGGSWEVTWDPLSSLMTLIVSGVGTLIHVFAIGYMHGDLRFGRFFCYLNLFAASMLTLVLAGNFAVLFLGWELVGLCSYLLISFWFVRPAAASAGTKAFVVNRIGDFGFMVALMIVFATFGTLSFGEVLEDPGTLLTGGAATAVGLLLLLAAAGKSAQIPLYVWLPDAMEGPTPVSALIHAATMVTAGVYLVARTAPIFALSPIASDTVAVVGAATALFAATIAIAQNDIKRVLAYSTISQLGYMVMAVGITAYTAGLFHLMTHAFFKALLFLAAGSVIHAMGDEQDMTRMGGLFRPMRVTAVTSAIAVLAISGIPPISGYWSKDDILASTFERGGWYYLLWAVGLFTAGLTAFYMARWFILTFLGEPRWAEGAHPHESPRVMTLPLVGLAVLTVFAGFVNTPFFPGLELFLEPSFEGVTQAHPPESPLVWILAGVSTLAGLAGIAIAAMVYLGPAGFRRAIGGRLSWVLRLWETGYGVDTAYDRALAQLGRRLAGVAAFEVDVKVIDGTVNGVGGVVAAIGRSLRPVQSGMVRSYAVLFAAGAVALVVWFVAAGT
jgi:NADH-quinone oxidoreductase subunit L